MFSIFCYIDLCVLKIGFRYRAQCRLTHKTKHSTTYGVSFFEEVDFPRSAIDSKGLGGACQLAYAAVLAGSISMSHASAGHD